MCLKIDFYAFATLSKVFYEGFAGIIARRSIMSKKKGNFQGSISFESARNRYRAAVTDPYGKRIVKRFKTITEADNWISIIKADIYKDEYVPKNAITVFDWVQSYIDTYCANNVRIRTLVDYQNSLKYLQPIGNIELQKLTPIRVQTLYNNLPKNLAQCSKYKVHRLLKAAIKKAMQIGLVNKNIMLAVTPPKVVKKEISVFTTDEMKTLLSTVENSNVYKKYYLLILLAAFTGCRIGELLGLKACNVHSGYIHIDCSLSYLMGVCYEQPPKTPSGVRDITLPAYMEKMLLDAAGTCKYVFHTKKGTPYASSNITYVWGKILKAAHLEHRCFHVLRHTHATQLLANGVPLLEVSRRLGHSMPSTTLDLYCHKVKGYDEKIPSKIEQMYEIKKILPDIQQEQ